MIKVEEVREKLAAVSSGELPLWDFYNWLEEASLNMHQDSSREAVELVGKVGILFSEFDRGSLPESVLQEKLCGLVHLVQFFGRAADAVRINASGSPVTWVAGSALTLAPVAASAQI